MGVNLFQTGVNGLFAAQSQLATTGHNIANVNTEGFNRQRVIQETTTPLTSGSQFIGTGTRITSVERVFDQYRFNELTHSNSANSFAESKATNLSQLDEQMSKVGKGITNSLNEFYSAFHSLTDLPSDLGVRQLTIDKASNLAANINSMHSTLENQVEGVNEELTASAQQVTALGQQLAIVNRDIISNQTQVAEPNDMLDQRDKLIQELAELTSVSTVETPDGALNVYIGNGQTLVAGTQSFGLSTADGSPDPKQRIMQLVSPAGIPQTIDSTKMGGSIGALVNFRDGELTSAINQLGVTAIGLADSVNELQSQGLDMNELTGQNFFQDVNNAMSQQRRVLSDDDNTGNLVGAVEITDISGLTGDDYQLDFDGVNYSVTNLDSGDVQVMPGVPFTLDGFTFNPQSGTANAGDKFLIQPSRQAGAELQVELNNPEQIAASSVVEVSASSENVSTGQVTLVSIDDATDPNFPSDGNPLTLEIYQDGGGLFQYQLKDSSGANVGPAGVYTPPTQQLSIAGMTFEIAGQPVGEGINAPEQFEFEYAFGASNGNNAKAMADLQTAKVLDGDRRTINDSFERNVVDVGSAASSAIVEAGATNTLFEQATTRVSSSSGVNIDEEASNLMRFQQAYSASARIITTANEIFQTLLQAAR